MGARASITVDNAQVKRAVAALIGKSTRLQPAFEEIGSSLVSSTQARFESEVSPDGKSWPELSPAYAKSGATKRRPGGRGTEHILRNRGYLFGSITYLASPIDVAVGSNRKQTAIQQLGGTEDMAPGPAAIPARPFLGVSPDDENEIGEILTFHFAEVLS